MQEKKNKGLCYYWNEKFHPSHRCNRPRIFLLETLNIDVDEKERVEGETTKYAVVERMENTAEEGELLKIFLYTIVGAWTP